MRVLILDTSVTYGGGQEGLLTLARGLRARGLEIRVLAVRGGRLASQLDEDEIRWLAWGLRSRERMRRGLRISELTALLAGMVEIIRSARRWRPDLLHANSERAALACALIPRSLRTRFVFHDRTLEERAGLVRWIGSRSDAVLAVSSAVALKHVRKDGEPGARIVEEGIDLSRFSPLPMRAERRPMVFAFVGRMSREKGPHVFAAAAREAIRAGLEAEFVFCGDRPSAGDPDLDREILEHVGGKETRNRFRMLGFRRDIAAVLQEVDVVVLPSFREGLGLAAIEALARGRPVIASRVGGLPEVVLDDRNGLLIEAGNVGQLARAMTRLAADSALYARLAECAPGTVGRFSEEAMIRSVSACYEEVLRSS